MYLHVFVKELLGRLLIINEQMLYLHFNSDTVLGIKLIKQRRRKTANKMVTIKYY